MSIDKEKNVEKIFGIPIAINEDIELAMKKEYAWSFEIDKDMLELLKAQDKVNQEPLQNTS